MEVVKDPGNDRDQVLVQMVNQYQGLLLRMCYICIIFFSYNSGVFLHSDPFFEAGLYNLRWRTAVF